MATAMHVHLGPRTCMTTLKGQCQEISTSGFSWISFPQAPEYTIRAIPNFFKNSRRYLQLKVHCRCRWHWWQMEKSSIRKMLIIFEKFTLRCLQPDIVPICHRCHWNRWQICLQCHWDQWQFCPGIIDTGGKFATDINNTSCTSSKFSTGVVDTGGKFSTGVVDTVWCTLTCAANFRKNSKWP